MMPTSYPPSKALYIPGPLVAAIKDLIDAYHERKTPVLSAALHRLEQAVLTTQPRPKKGGRPRNPKKATDTAVAKSSAEVTDARKPVKKARKVKTTVTLVEKDYPVDLVARLNRDHPVIAERYAMGEFKTVRDAAIAAGIRVE